VLARQGAVPSRTQEPGQIPGGSKREVLKRHGVHATTGLFGVRKLGREKEERSEENRKKRRNFVSEGSDEKNGPRVGPRANVTSKVEA